MLDFLLRDDPLAHYWIGFILADGHFEFERKRVIIGVDCKDENHIEKLAAIIKKPVYHYASGMRCMSITDRQNFSLITEKFGIYPSKTITPPDFKYSDMSDINFFALFMGLFDGDGTIRGRNKKRDCYGRIKMHGSWLSNLEKSHHRILSIMPNNTRQKPKMNKLGYSEWCLPVTLLRGLKERAIELNLPILERKWDKI